MLLADPNPTPLDLRFRLFGTDVRVHPLFWLISALFGWSWKDARILPGGGLGEVALWVFCTFVSILLHEFGHVWMGRAFGSRGHILLHGMGGLAVGSADVSRRWQRILVSAAGPGIQLLFFVALLGFSVVALVPLGNAGTFGAAAVLTLNMLLWINLVWPLFNLLPIWPLDGGWITRDLFEMISPRQGLLASLWVSLLVAGALAANAVFFLVQQRVLIPYVGAFFTGPYVAILFVMFSITAIQGIMSLSQARQRRYWDDEDDDAPPWRR